MDLVQMPDGSWVSSAEGQRAWEERNKMRERSGVPPGALTLRRRTEINLPSIIKTKDIDDFWIKSCRSKWGFSSI